MMDCICNEDIEIEELLEWNKQLTTNNYKIHKIILSFKTKINLLEGNVKFYREREKQLNAVLKKTEKEFFCSNCFDTEYSFCPITGEKELCRKCWNKYSLDCAVCKGTASILDDKGFLSTCLSCAEKYPDFEMYEDFYKNKAIQLNRIKK